MPEYVRKYRLRLERRFWPEGAIEVEATEHEGIAECRDELDDNLIMAVRVLVETGAYGVQCAHYSTDALAIESALARLPEEADWSVVERVPLGEPFRVELLDKIRMLEAGVEVAGANLKRQRDEISNLQRQVESLQGQVENLSARDGGWR